MHIYANIKAARSLQLTSLNPARLDILLAHYLATQVRIRLTVRINLEQHLSACVTALSCTRAAAAVL